MAIIMKEITPPVGYLADESEYDLVCSYEGDLVVTVERSCTSPEQVKSSRSSLSKQPITARQTQIFLKGRDLLHIW